MSLPSTGHIFVLNAGHRERQALLRWWKKNAADACSFAGQMEKTVFDLKNDQFILPQGGTVKVVDCIALEA